MLAAVFEGEGKLSVKEVEKPEIRKANDVLLNVEAASICGTDLQILSVPPGHPAQSGVILGHEYCGRILEVGEDVNNLKPGDRVVVDPNLTCGNCNYCRLGMTNMCENMTTLGIFLNGGFAEYNIASERALHKISPELYAELAVFAEPLSCVVNAMEKIKILPGDIVVILGAGPIGLYFVQLAKASGAGKIIVSEISDYRINFATKCGADIVVNPKKENLENVIKKEAVIGADIIIDAVGVLFKEALKLVRRGGKILLFGMNREARAEITQYEITRSEIEVIGTYISHFSFPKAIKILQSNILPIKELITHRFSLKEIEKGFEVMRKGEALEVIIYPKKE